MNTLAVSLFFSAGLPLLMPFAALALALTYCIDKVTVRHHPGPPVSMTSHTRPPFHPVPGPPMTRRSLCHAESC